MGEYREVQRRTRLDGIVDLRLAVGTRRESSLSIGEHGLVEQVYSAYGDPIGWKATIPGSDPSPVCGPSNDKEWVIEKLAQTLLERRARKIAELEAQKWNYYMSEEV